MCPKILKLMPIMLAFYSLMLVHTCYYAGIVYLPLLATILKIIAIKLYHTDWVFTSIRCREHYLNSCFTQLLDNYHQTQS